MSQPKHHREGKVYKLEVCESTCEEKPSNYEVESYTEDSDNEKEELIMKISYEKGNNELTT